MWINNQDACELDTAGMSALANMKWKRLEQL